MSDPTRAYVNYYFDSEGRPQAFGSEPLKDAKRKSKLVKEFFDLLNSKFEVQESPTTGGEFGWVAENGDEFLLTFYKHTWSPNSKRRRWTEYSALGSIYLLQRPESETTLDERRKVAGKYDQFVEWLYEKLFEGKIPYLP